MKRHFLIAGFLFVVLLLTGVGCISFSSGKKGTSGPAGMFASTDKGESWKQIVALPKPDSVKSIAGVSVYKLFNDPQDSKAMYIATRENGMYFTYDEGQSWQQPEDPLSSGFIYSIAIHPTSKCTIYVTNGVQVFKSNDCNRSWKEVYRESRSDVQTVSLSFNYYPPYWIYLAESNGDLLQSADEGKSWGLVKRFEENHSKVRLAEVLNSPLQKDLLYVISRDKGLYRSDDGGGTWKPLGDKIGGFPGALEYRRYAFHPKNIDIFYWISTYGVLVTDNRGESWRPLGLITPPGSVNIYGFAISPKGDKEIYYTATVQERSTFYKTIDAGKNWITKKLPSGQIPTALRVHPEKDNVLYLGFTIPPKK